MESSSTLVYHAKGSAWKVIGNSNAAIALLVMIFLLSFSFYDPTMLGELLLPAILLEVGLVASWLVLVLRQTALTYLTITTTQVEYAQPRLQGFHEPVRLLLTDITGVRIESGNVVLLTAQRRHKLEFIGQARHVAEILRQQIAQASKK
jgi:hypothetical protein